MDVCRCIFKLLRDIVLFPMRIYAWIKEFRMRWAEWRLSRLPDSEALHLGPGQSSGGSSASTVGQPRGPVGISPPRSRGLETTNTVSPGIFECLVCFQKISSSQFPSRKPTAACPHPIECCKACLSQSITSSFQSRIWNDIKCPTCNAQLQHQDVADFAPPDVFERYDGLSTRLAIQKELPDFRWCPGPQCNFGQEHPDGSNQSMITCTACGGISCFKHNVQWHEGITCAQYDAKFTAGAMKREKKSENVIKRISKKCPGCQRQINKNGGCPHMSCICGKDFCWTCLHDYPGHAWSCKDR